jgi:hypothetical protein
VKRESFPPGTLIKFADEDPICTVLHTWNEIYEGESHLIVRYLHPFRGILERTYYFYEGMDTLEMRGFEVIS